jgi:hypothetical protein
MLDSKGYKYVGIDTTYIERAEADAKKYLISGEERNDRKHKATCLKNKKKRKKRNK